MPKPQASPTTIDREGSGPSAIGLSMTIIAVAIVAAITAEVRWVGPPDARTMELRFPQIVAAIAVVLGAYRLARLVRRLAAEREAHEPRASASVGNDSARPDSPPAERARGAGPRVLLSRKGKTVRLLDPSRIDWLEASGRYVTAHAGAETHLLDESLAALSKTLPSSDFVRVHRSAIVRLDRVVEIRRLDGRDFELRLSTGDRVRMSRTHRAHLARALGTDI